MVLMFIVILPAEAYLDVNIHLKEKETGIQLKRTPVSFFSKSASKEIGRRYPKFLDTDFKIKRKPVYK